MDKQTLFRRALLLAWITIVYNVIECAVSIVFGISDDTLALLGFGVDSFVELLSGIGILHMLYRMRGTGIEQQGGFEKRALRITGGAFYMLAVGLVAAAGLNAYQGHKPETTMVGVIVGIASLLTMYFIYKAKLRTGKALHSDAIVADANCTKTCFYFSFVLLGSSLLYEFFQIGWLDIAGSLGIAWLAFKEGREAMEKAESGKMACGCGEKCKITEK